jgi:hypothetical protein
MSQIPQVASTQGSPSFDPDAFFEAWAQETLTPPYDNDFRKFIIKAFGLKPNDSFVYRAVAEVTLLQAQTYLEFGGQGGLHGWYLDEEGKEVSSFRCCHRHYHFGHSYMHQHIQKSYGRVRCTERRDGGRSRDTLNWLAII